MHCVVAVVERERERGYIQIYYGAILEFKDCAIAVVYIALAQLERYYATPFAATMTTGWVEVPFYMMLR